MWIKMKPEVRASGISNCWNTNFFGKKIPTPGVVED